MITREKFEFMKSKYGHLASWAIWAHEGETPTSNMGELTALDPDKNKDLLSKLNPDIVLVALNFSIDIKQEPWENFHKYRPHATDFKTRYALRDTPLWGAYMTDILKDYPEKDSNKVIAHLKKHPDLQKKNIESFLQEIKYLGTTNPLIVAFGDIVYNILKENLSNKFKIIKIPHYANRTNKEKYREKVKKILNS